MKNDLQKASMLKRISAYTFDMILLVCLVIALAAALSGILHFDDYNAQMDAVYEKYGQEYGINVSLTMEEYEKLSEEDLLRYEQALEALNKDQEALRVYSMVTNLTLLIASLSILLGYLLLELLVPLLFGNGQTLGKKIFGIALMRTDSVKVTPFMMFVRTVLGKCAVETMIPVLVIIMLLFNAGSAFGLLIVGLILLVQVILLIATHTNSAIHDFMACTVAVDMASQMMFDTPEARLAYQKRLSAEAANKAEY